MKPLIVANWKCNPESQKKAKALFDSIKKGIKSIKNVEVVICPPFIYLPTFNFQLSTLKLGAQNCFFKDSGPFTGEVSPKILKDLGCEYVILGHSERRMNFNETDEMINKKLKAVLKSGLKPILCVGENEKQRKSGKTKQVLKNQLKNCFKNILSFKKFYVSRLAVAYEPVWAIGTGNPCKISDAAETLIYLKKALEELLGAQNSKKIRILYGGSVSSQNAKPYIEKAGFKGLLIGNASLNAKEFIKTVKTIDKI